MDHNRLTSQTQSSKNVPQTSAQNKAWQNVECTTSEIPAESNIKHKEQCTVSQWSDESTHHYLHRNHDAYAYKTDERISKQIFRNNVQCVNPNHKLKLVIYYKSSLTTSLVMKNDQSTPPKDYCNKEH